MRQLLTIIFTVYAFTIFAQPYSKCRVFQYIDEDSLNQKLVSVFTYNTKGQLTSFYYDGFKECLACGRDGQYWNVYDSMLLHSTTSFFRNTNDSSRTIFFYNSSGQKIKEEYFDCTRKKKKGADTGFGHRDVVFDSDFEKDRTWSKSGEKNFKYDARGNCIYTEGGPNSSPGEQHILTYDLQNRIIVDSSFWYSYILSTEFYIYSRGGYQTIQTSFDNEGKPKQFKERDYEYRAQYFTTYKLNGKGQIIEAIVKTEKGEIESSKIIFYDLAGNIKRETLFDPRGRYGQKKITSIYLYD